MPTVIDFDVQAGPYRSELLVHCYRMLGSVHEAEDLVQETMLRAWRAWERYDDDLASLRTWLYKIATNVCLTALRGRARRPLPSGLGGPSGDPDDALVPSFETPWLQPFPDSRLTDPAAQLVRRDGLRLALIAAMQTLPPKQRAVLILRDVLEFSAAEVAEQLDTSVAAVNSALQRARASVSVKEGDVVEPGDNAVIDRYIKAFEAADVATLVSLLTEDAVLEMPPTPLWLAGRVDCGHFMERVFATRGTDWRLFPTSANGQPATVAYCRDETGTYRLHSLQVFTVTKAGISHSVVFPDPEVLAAFGLAPTIDHH